MSQMTLEQALAANFVLQECIAESNGDLEAALSAAEYILSGQPLEPEPEPSIDAYFAHDMHNRRAQGVLNRALEAAKDLSKSARSQLVSLLKRGDAGRAILDFVDKHRVQLAKLLSSTQLAAVLEGARESASKVPTLAAFPGAVPPPPSLEPKQAIDIVERLEKLGAEARAELIYNLPADQQTYVQQALATKEATPPPRPPSFVPPAPPAGEPERVHFPVIEEAVKQLSEKNVLTRDKFDALDAASRAKAFTVAKVSADETLAKIRDSLADNIREGVDYEAWRKKVLADVDKGTFLSDAHQENVFRTVVQTQFSDGQETVLSHPLVRSGFPYRARHAIHDDRVRETHLALEKLGIQGTNIYRADDPVWQLFRAPWDYNDRCNDTALTVRQAAEAGIKEAQQWLETGVEPSPPAHVPMPDFRPPPGFARAVAAAPLSIQLSLRSLSSFAEGKWHDGYAQKASLPGLSSDEYPRDAANRFIDKYKLAEAALDPACAAKLRESIPQEQHWKLDRAVSHLQSGGVVHHPKEPPGMAVGIDGRIADPRWRTYTRRAEEFAAWSERNKCRDECRAVAEEATEAIRSGEPLHKADHILKRAGATEAEMRAISRMRHLVTTGKKPQETLEELYEDTVELIQRRIDANYETDPKPEEPEEPDCDESAPLSLGPGGQEDVTSSMSDKEERVRLIADILVALFGDGALEVARKLKRDRQRASQGLSMEFAIDPKTGYWHGPTPPSPNWTQIGQGTHGGLIWAPAASG